MNYKLLWLSLAMFSILVLFLGCSGSEFQELNEAELKEGLKAFENLWSSIYNSPPPTAIPIFSEKRHSLNEGWYFYHKIYISSLSDVYIPVKVYRWKSRYALEVFFMNSWGFERYRSGKSFSTIARENILSSGEYLIRASRVGPGYYYVVVDNTDKGWSATDFDGENDYAVFDIEVYISLIQ